MHLATKVIGSIGGSKPCFSGKRPTKSTSITNLVADGDRKIVQIRACYPLLSGNNLEIDNVEVDRKMLPLSVYKWQGKYRQTTN